MSQLAPSVSNVSPFRRIIIRRILIIIIIIRIIISITITIITIIKGMIIPKK